MLTRDVCREEGIRLNVYRPSIVYGDSRTGRSLRFNALYYPVKAALFLRDLYLRTSARRGGEAAEMGIRLEGRRGPSCPSIEVGAGRRQPHPGRLLRPGFPGHPGGALDGGIYHLVNRRLKRIEDIVEYAMRIFRL